MHIRKILVVLTMAVIVLLSAASASEQQISSKDTGFKRITSGDFSTVDTGSVDTGLGNINPDSIRLEEILDRADQTEKASQDQVQDYICHSTLIMRQPQKDGSAKTVMVQDKTVYFQAPDRQREIFHSITKDGQVLSPEKLAEFQEKTDRERRKDLKENDPDDDQKDDSQKDNGRKGSMAMSARSPWTPEERAHYSFQLLPADTIRGFPCYVLEMTPQEESEQLIRGRAWLRQNTCQVVALDFQPAENPKFVKKAHMMLDFDQVQPGIWLPVEMKVDAAGGFLFIKKSFQLHQTWRDYQVNVGLPDSLFLLPD